MGRPRDRRRIESQRLEAHHRGSRAPRGGDPSSSRKYANAAAVAIQSLVLENEGWERDDDVAEPAEPSFDKPAGKGRSKS
jgi:hypothetical protein